MGTEADHISVTVTEDSDLVKIYVYGCLHFHFLRKYYRGMSSYHENVYTIEILLQDQELILEYNDKSLWAEVLKVLDENI